MEIDPPSMVIGSSSLDLSQSSSSTVEVSNVSNGMVTEATPTMTTSAGTAATGTPAIAMMPMAAMATPLMQSSLSSSTVPTAASVPALSFTQFRDRSAAAAAATSNNKRVKAGGESAMKDDDGMMNGNGATDNADMATANSNSRNGNNNSTTNAKPDKALRQQKRLERMQQARQHINQLTPKQRRQLTKRLKHTAKALLSPLEKSMLRVLFRRQCGLEPALSSSPKKIKQEKRAAKATVDPEDVMAWSRNSMTMMTMPTLTPTKKLTSKSNSRRVVIKKKKKQNRVLRKHLKEKEQTNTVLFSGLGECMEQLAVSSWSATNIQSLKNS